MGDLFFALAIVYVLLFAGMIYVEVAHAKERKDLLNRIMSRDIDEYVRINRFEDMDNLQEVKRPRNFVAAHQRKNGIRKTVLGDESREHPDEF